MTDVPTTLLTAVAMFAASLALGAPAASAPTDAPAGASRVSRVTCGPGSLTTGPSTPATTARTTSRGHTTRLTSVTLTLRVTRACAWPGARVAAPSRRVTLARSAADVPARTTARGRTLRPGETLRVTYAWTPAYTLLPTPDRVTLRLAGVPLTGPTPAWDGRLLAIDGPALSSLVPRATAR